MQEFNAQYFQSRQMQVDSGHYFSIGERLANVLGSQTFLEVGCGCGHLVRHLRNRGVEARGIDVSEWAVRQAASPHVTQENFTTHAGRYDVVVVNELFNALDDEQFNAFLEWSKNATLRNLVIFNNTDHKGEGDRIRPSDEIRRAFEAQGWHINQGIDYQLRKATDWNLLVLTRRKGHVLEKAVLSRDFNTMSLIVDCWAGNAALKKFVSNLHNWLIPDLELIFVNASRCSEFPELLQYENDVSFITHSSVPVTVIEEQFRSTSVAFYEGLRVARGAVASYFPVEAQVTRDFYMQIISKLLREPNFSFVIPFTHAVSKLGSDGWLNDLDCRTLSVIQKSFKRPVRLSADIQLLQSWDLRLSEIASANIPPIYAARIEDLRSLSRDLTQNAFGAEDFLIQLVYEGFSGASLDQICSLTLPPPETRFATSEVNHSKMQLLGRPR